MENNFSNYPGEEFIAKLAVLFEGFSDEEIDHLVAEIKKRVSIKRVEEKNESSGQLEMFEDHGDGEVVVSDLT